MVIYATSPPLLARRRASCSEFFELGAGRPSVFRYASPAWHSREFAYLRRPRATRRDVTVKRAADNGRRETAHRSRRGRVLPL